MAASIWKHVKFKKSFLDKLAYLSDVVTRISFSTCSSEGIFDMVVLGGGSGGLACAKQAAMLGRRVAVLDNVKPSPQGTTWGLGGTCVNVGCIPKKLMHHAATLGHSLDTAKTYGWDVPDNMSVSWEKLTAGIQNYIKSQNWGHRVQLHQRNVEYINAKGTFLDTHTVRFSDNKGNETFIKSKHFVLAVGMRPKYPQVLGAARHAITSDDLFWLSKPPGKTLVVGASYVALECAGFLTGLGYDTSLMIRSIPLRGFDQQMANLIVDHMVSSGTSVYKHCVPEVITKDNSDKLDVTWANTDSGTASCDVFDTVLLAVGREAQTQDLGLDTIGIELDKESHKVIGGYDGDQEKSSLDHIYAIGDVLQDKPELTPVAIQAGKLLANRLFNDSNQQMNYDLIPTTVFTPLEYGSVGLSEEEALSRYGDDQIEVFHAFYKPLEYAISGQNADQCYIKVIAHRGIAKPCKVLGFHFLGPNAGEVTQGFAAAMQCGLTVDQLQNTVGIHPTSAEEIVKLHITKRSGLDPVVTSC